MSTLMFCHAHPDDEALLTAGTMAKAVEHGHRVVLVVATDGAAGLTSQSRATQLANERRAEVTRSAEILGVHDLVLLDYPDSGFEGSRPDSFVTLQPQDIADRLHVIASEVGADILIGYDPAGGYGHPDHRHLHRSLRLAALAINLERQSQLFEATLPREAIRWGARLAKSLGLAPAAFDPTEFDDKWTPRSQITNRVGVHRYLRAKRAAQAAHSSQKESDGGQRTLAVLSRLPHPLALAVLGTEFYVSIPSRDLRP